MRSRFSFPGGECPDRSKHPTDKRKSRKWIRLALYDPLSDYVDDRPIAFIGEAVPATPANLQEAKLTIAEFNNAAERDREVQDNLGVFWVDPPRHANRKPAVYCRKGDVLGFEYLGRGEWRPYTIVEIGRAHV